jgi:uncharacterized protein
LLRLARVTGDVKYERFAITVLRLVASQLRRYPQGFGRALSAMEFSLCANREIAVIGETGNVLAREILKRYLPDTVVVQSSDAKADQTLIPLLKDRKVIDGKPTVYICENYVCKLPLTGAAAVVQALNEKSTPSENEVL